MHKKKFDNAHMNLDQVAAFVRVIELGSFSAAAERLGMTQPGVSQKVRALEGELGVRLVERVGRRMRPTAAGTDLIEHAARIEAAVETALSVMDRHATGEVGRVRIGTGTTACIYHLPPVFRAVRRRVPALEITISTGHTHEIVRAVEDNLIDIGFVTLPAAGRMLEVSPICADEFVFIAAAETADLPDRVTPDVARSLPLLLTKPDGNTRQIIDAWFAGTGPALRPVMSLSSTEAIKQMVGVGIGCAIVPAICVDDDHSRRNLIVRPLSPPLSRTQGLVLRKDKPLYRGLREMVHALETLRVQ